MTDRSDDTRAGRRGAPVGVTLVAALAIAGLLQFAAAAKFISASPHLTLWEGGPRRDYVIAAAEMVIVLLLVALHRWRYAWAAMVVLFMGFSGYVLQAWIGGRPCGCFGNAIKLPGWFSVAMDAVIVVVSLVLALWQGLRLKAAVAVVAIGAVAYAGGYLFGMRSGPPQETGVEVPVEPQPEPQPIAAGDADAPPATPTRTAPTGPTQRITAAEYLLRSDMLADIREQPEGGPAWYVFYHDPHCSVCEMMLPIVETYMHSYADNDDPGLRVRTLSAPEVEEKAGIDIWSFEQTPTAFLVQDGVITHEWWGEQAPVPDEMFYADLTGGTLPESMRGPDGKPVQ